MVLGAAPLVLGDERSSDRGAPYLIYARRVAEHRSSESVSLARSADLTGVGGIVEAPRAGDVFGALASNADGTKIDFCVRRSLSYRVDLGEGGGSTVEVVLTAENTAPKHPERSYVFRPYPRAGLEPEVSKAFVSMYCAPSSAGSRTPPPTGSHRASSLIVNAGFRCSRPSFRPRRGPRANWRPSCSPRTPGAGASSAGPTGSGSGRRRQSCRNRERSRSRRPRTAIVDATPGMCVEDDVATWEGDL